MSKVAGNPFKINWEDKDTVIAYAKKLGAGQTVFKVKGRKNYNITFTSRPDQWQGHEVVYQT